MTDRRPLEPEDLYRLRLISDPQISPDGSRIVFVLKEMNREKDEYLSALYVVERAGSVSRFTAGEKDWGPRWSPDGRSLAFVSGRKDEAQIYLLPAGGGERIVLTDRKLGAGLPLWAPDSSAIAFVGQVALRPESENEPDGSTPAKMVERSSYKLDGAGYIGGRRRHIFVVDVADRSLRQITDGDYHDDNPSWSPDGRRLVFSSGRSPSWDLSPQSSIYLVDRDGGAAEEVVPGGAYGRPVFSPDGRRIAFVGHRDPDDVFAPARLYSADRTGAGFREELGEWDGALGNDILSDVVLSAEEHAVTLLWRPDGIYFLGTERGACNLYRSREGRVHPVTHGRHAVTDFCLAADGTVAYACADSTHPVEVFVRRGEDAEQLTHENASFLQEVAIVPPERIEFAGAGGERGEGWLLTPRRHGWETHPLIVYIHGGPQFAHGEALFFEYQLLAGQGFGIFYPNIHGSSSYGRGYQTSINGDWGNLDYRDVLTGTEEAASRPWVDRDRLGIAGGSYGGYLTSWVVSHDNRFRAAVVERCLCNIVSFMGTSDSGWLWNRQFGTYPEGDVQKLWDMSPLKYVQAVTAPVLVMHAEGDDRTPVEQGEQLFNALRRLGKETRLVLFPSDESHGLSRIGKPSHRVERLRFILDWFAEHLAGVPPAPE